MNLQGHIPVTQTPWFTLAFTLGQYIFHFVKRTIIEYPLLTTCCAECFPLLSHEILTKQVALALLSKPGLGQGHWPGWWWPSSWWAAWPPGVAGFPGEALG